MPPKPSLELSDTHLKVLDELELLTDAYISTFTQIGKTINVFSEEINSIIKKFLSEKPLWRKYTSQCYDLSYKPFCYDYGKEFLTDFLSFQFAVEGQLSLTKEIQEGGKKKTANYFNLRWGFYYDKEQEPDKYFYFTINRYAKRYGGPIMNLNEYVNLLNKQNKINFDHTQAHPEEGDMNEYLELSLDYYKKDNLSNLFAFFKDELLATFLSKIKD